MNVDVMTKRIRLDRRLNSVIMLHKFSNNNVNEVDLFNEVLLEGLHAIGILDQDEYEKLKQALNEKSDNNE